VGFFGQFFSLFRRKSQPSHIEDEIDERRLSPRVNPRPGTRVLVIDDSPTILTAMKRFLESAHCVFLGALDAKMGMEVALTQKPDLIFLDIVMPGINGFAALRALRKNARTRDTPIIMMSGNEQAKAQFFGAHIGADDFMKKPFSRFDVFKRIAVLLDANRIPRRMPMPLQERPHALQPERTFVRAETLPPQVSEVPPSQVAEPESPAPTTLHVTTQPTPPAEVPVVTPPKESEPEPEPPVLTVDGPPAAPAVPVLVAEPVALPTDPPAHVEPETPTTPHLVSAQVLSIAQPIIPSPPPAAIQPASVQPELLARIARLAQLAQSDPEALKALVVLATQLIAQSTATEAVPPATIKPARASAP
jgi:twitching motility two-component system response regulator PilH